MGWGSVAVHLSLVWQRGGREPSPGMHGQLVFDDRITAEQAICAAGQLTMSLLLSQQAGRELQLGMRIQLVHGDELIADSSEAGGLAAACARFKAWVRKTYTL